MITIRSPTTKTLLLITLTTLTIGLGMGLSWDSPGRNSDIGNSANIAFSDNDGDSSGTYNIDYRQSDDDSWNNASPSDVDDTGSSISFDWDTTNLEGVYTLNITDDSEAITREFNIDNQDPTVDFNNLDYVSDNPTVTVTADDNNAGVDNVDASADNSASVDNVDDGNCDGDSSCDVEIEIDTGDLEQGDEFDLDVTPEDSVGNSDTSSTSITFDSEWDGDSSADVEWSESGSNVLNGFEDEDQDLSIFFEPDSVSDTSVECFVDGESVDSDSLSPSDEEEEAVCEFDHNDYSGDVLDLTVEVEDETGNGETLVDGEELVWDTDSPSIDSLEQPDDISRFNSGFDLSLSASDDASGIDLVEYYFDANTDVGEGTEVGPSDSGDLGFDEGFEVDTGDLGQDNHTVYVRVVDVQDKQSVESFDFEYYPGRDPDVELNATGSIEVASGESTSFDLTMGNEAPFFVESIEVSSEDGTVWNGSKEALNLESGDDVVKTVSIDASGLEPGVYELNLGAEGYEESITVEVVVRANESQRTSINSSLSDWREKRDELEKNVSSIGTASPSDMKEFNDSMSEAEEYVANNNYYEAKQVLDGINSSYSEARQNYSEKLEEHETNQRNLLIGALIFFVLIGGGAGGFIVLKREDSEKLEELISEEYMGYIPEELIPENVELPEQLGEVKKRVEESELGERVKELVGSEDDKKDVGYSFDDFN